MPTSPEDQEFAIVTVSVEMEVLVRANDLPNITDDTVAQLVPHGVTQSARLKRVVRIIEGTATNVSYSSSPASS